MVLFLQALACCERHFSLCFANIFSTCGFWQGAGEEGGSFCMTDIWVVLDTLLLFFDTLSPAISL